jgi:hypothetical protein
MNQLFDATRQELESSNFILSVALDDALSHCKAGRYDSANESAIIVVGLFDRLALRLRHVIDTIREHGSHFGTLPNVKPLSASNFRGVTAQRVSRVNSLLAKVLFRERTRFFHKLHSLGEIVEHVHQEARAIIEGISDAAEEGSRQAWDELEVLGYDLNTCMGETTILLKSFFCALPPKELESFRQKLVRWVPPPIAVGTGRAPSWRRK